MAEDTEYEPGMIPVMMDELTGINTRAGLTLKAVPGDVLRAIGSAASVVPVVGPMGGSGWQSMGDVADYALGQPSSPGMPDVSDNYRRQKDALVATAVGGILGGIGSGITKFLAPVAKRVFNGKTADVTTKALTQMPRGKSSFVFGGRPGVMSPKASEVNVYGIPYRPNSEAEAYSIGAKEAKPMPHEPDYYLTHSRDEGIPTEYKGLTLTPEQYRLADRMNYGIMEDRAAGPQLIPIRPKEDVLDFTKGAPRPGDGLSDDFIFVREPENTVPSDGTSLIVPSKEVGPYTGPTVEVHGTPRVKPAAEATPAAPTSTEAEMFREVPTFKYNREATARRMPKRPVSTSKNDKFNMWKDFERKVVPEAARDYAFEQWYKNAPIGGVQGIAHAMGPYVIIPMGAAQTAVRANPSTPMIRSWMLGSGTPSDTTERSAPTAPKAASDTVGKRMKAAGFEPRTRTQSRQTEKPQQSSTDIRLQNFDTNF